MIVKSHVAERMKDRGRIRGREGTVDGDEGKGTDEKRWKA